MSEANTYLFLVAYAILPISIAFVSLMIYIGYRKRNTTILKIFGSQFFRFGIVNPAGQLEWLNKTTNDMKIYGKVIFFNYKEGAYRVQEDRLFWIDKIPTSIYKFGNPNPLNVMGISDPEIEVYDEDLKQHVKVKLSSQELKGALESKVVNELNKVGFNRIEMIVLLFMGVTIVLEIISLYEIFNVNSEYSTLINQLNQILQHYAQTTTTSSVP